MPQSSRIQTFRVRISGSYRTYTSSGYGYGSATGLTESTGFCGTGVPISQKFRVDMKMLYPGVIAWTYSTHRGSGHGYERHTELTEVPGTGMVIPGQIPQVWFCEYPTEHSLGHFPSESRLFVCLHLKSKCTRTRVCVYSIPNDLHSAQLVRITTGVTQEKRRPKQPGYPF